jgi:RHS repeat-associated protein
MAGISSRASTFGEPQNKLKFNGIEQNTDFDMNMYDAHYRNLDPQIGRFWQLDPKPTEFYSLYTSMENNPILKMDPLGDKIKIGGSEEDRNAYVEMLNKTSGNTYKIDENGYLTRTSKTLNKKSDKTKSATLSALIEKGIKAKKTIDVNLINADDKDSKMFLFDKYKTAQIDVGDLKKVDDNTFLAAKIGHTLSEYLGAPDISKRTYENYTPNHEIGKQTESRIVSEMEGKAYSLLKLKPEVLWRQNNPDLGIQGFTYTYSYGSTQFVGVVGVTTALDPSGEIISNFKRK